VPDLICHRDGPCSWGCMPVAQPSPSSLPRSTQGCLVLWFHAVVSHPPTHASQSLLSGCLLLTQIGECLCAAPRGEPGGYAAFVERLLAKGGGRLHKADLVHRSAGAFGEFTSVLWHLPDD
jgi:hypothetical protein